MEILGITDEGLGHTSHLIGLGDGMSGGRPGSFPDRQREFAAARGWQIACTADTRSHADYISGGPDLAPSRRRATRRTTSPTCSSST